MYDEKQNGNTWISEKENKKDREIRNLRNHETRQRDNFGRLTRPEWHTSAISASNVDTVKTPLLVENLWGDKLKIWKSGLITKHSLTDK